MSAEERKILCKPPIIVFDYLGNNNFEWGIKFKSLCCCLYNCLWMFIQLFIT